MFSFTVLFLIMSACNLADTSEIFQFNHEYETVRRLMKKVEIDYTIVLL